MAQNTLPSEAIVEVATRALNSPKGIAIGPFETEGQAIYWNQRFNAVKAKMIKNHPNHEWRTLTCRRVGAKVLLEPMDAHILDLPIEEIK